MRRCIPILLVAVACSRDAAAPVAPVTPPTVPPPAAPSNLWSDARSWPAGAVPAAGAAVLIPEGKRITLDVSPPALRSLVIDGQLTFDEKDVALSADYIVVHGTLQVGSEESPFQHRASITLTGTSADETALGLGTKALAVNGGRLELHGAHRVAWTRLAATARAGATSLTLERAPGWLAGDRIVLASTDFDPAQLEELVVSAVNGTSVTVQQPLRFTHWGEMQSIGGRALDERAEVGLLTRNVIVRGDDASAASGMGGHIIVTQGATAHVEGVELFMLGQKGKVARYPMHWHLAGEVSGQYARDNSVWRTFNRCITVHGSHAATVDGNVCYDHLGHGYFIEDGNETRNVLSGNLGLGSRAPAAGEAVIPTDATPATFWITNPDNAVRGNVAAGSRAFGFWYALPEHPTGLSTTASVWPRRTPLREFANNVAHSNQRAGLFVDNGPNPDGTTASTSYAPRTDPSNGSSAYAVASFTGFTAWKHGGGAVWLRGANLRLVGATLADNGIGVTFAANETFLQDAVVIGESANNATKLGTFPVRGFEFYDGRVGAERVVFVNFQPNGSHQASAIGFHRNNAFGLNTTNFIKGAQLLNANGVYVEDPHADKDGDKAAVFLDGDGSLTGTAGRFIAANVPILVTPACVRRSEWNAYVCGGQYAQFYVNSGSAESVAPLTIARDDGAAIALSGIGGAAISAAMSLPTRRAYAVQLASAVAKPRLYLRSAAAGEWMRLAIPYAQASFAVTRDYDASHPLPAAASLAELDASTGGKFFYDAATGTLYLKAQVQPGRDYAALFVDPK